MEKYVTSLKELVELTIRNYTGLESEANGGDPKACFRLGMVHLLGIDTPVDFKRASQYLGNISLKNDPDANRIQGFIAEYNGDISSAFKYYALSVELPISQLQKVVRGRDELQQSFSKLGLPLLFNGELSNILSEIDKDGMLTSKITLALLSEEQLICKEVAKELFVAGDIYSAKLLLMKSNINKNDELYQEIKEQVSQIQVDMIISKATVVELNRDSILPDYDKLLCIANIKNKCDEDARSCNKEWKTALIFIINKEVTKLKRTIAKEKAKRNRLLFGIGMFAFFSLVGYCLFGLGWWRDNIFATIFYFIWLIIIIRGLLIWDFK